MPNKYLGKQLTTILVKQYPQLLKVDKKNVLNLNINGAWTPIPEQYQMGILLTILGLAYAIVTLDPINSTIGITVHLTGIIFTLDDINTLIHDLNNFSPQQFNNQMRIFLPGGR